MNGVFGGIRPALKATATVAPDWQVQDTQDSQRCTRSGQIPNKVPLTVDRYCNLLHLKGIWRRDEIISSSKCGDGRVDALHFVQAIRLVTEAICTDRANDASGKTSLSRDTVPLNHYYMLLKDLVQTNMHRIKRPTERRLATSNQHLIILGMHCMYHTVSINSTPMIH